MSAQASPLQEALEWNRFLQWASTQAFSESGKETLLQLQDPTFWAQTVQSAELLQQETKEMLPLLDRESLWGEIRDLPDAEPLLQALEKGVVLSSMQLFCLRRLLAAVECWQEFPKEELGAHAQRFRSDLNALPPVTDSLNLLERILTQEGEIAPSASPLLGRLTSAIGSLKKEIQSLLDSLLVNYSELGILQEKFSDIRDGRYVLPVKISRQHEMEGITYGVSSSKQTVFVEPREVSLLNNRLRQHENELEQEIFRILSEAAATLFPFVPDFRKGFAILTHWDAVQSKARLARTYSGKPINLSRELGFVLRQTAHPLLWTTLPSEQIVRNDIEFNDPHRILLLTGPNTGGKTVCLKTLGMAAVFARTGFMIPASEPATVPFFDSVFADFGDPQSLTEHLSSFSGHILRFNAIFQGLTERSLVLIDELNTATDPEEGAALGRALLETLLERNATVIATTHDAHLKALALQNPRILNASFAFDEMTALPTFHLMTGIAGRSRALETARRLGLPQAVLAKAQSYLSQGHMEFERLLSELEKHSRESREEAKKATQLRAEAEQLKTEWTAKTQAQLNEILDRVRLKLRRILEKTQDEARATLQKLSTAQSRKAGEQVRGSSREVEEVIREELPEFAVRERSEAAEAAPTTFKVGEWVRIPKWKTTGNVLEILEGKAKVSMGNLQVTLPLADLEPLLAEEAKKLTHQAAKKTATTMIVDPNRPTGVPAEIDLRGKRLEDAMLELEHYLDQAFRSGEHRMLTVVHGLGTGALREGARKLLQTLPYVQKIQDAPPSQGGAGATLVELSGDG